MAEVYIDRGNPEKGQTPKTGGRLGASPRTPCLLMPGGRIATQSITLTLTRNPLDPYHRPNNPRAHRSYKASNALGGV